MEIPQKTKIEPPYDPALPLLGIHPKEMETGHWKDIYTPLLTAALFTIAKMWRQPTRPSVDARIKKMRGTYTHIQRRIIQPWEKGKSCLLWQHGWSLKASRRVKRARQTNTAWHHLYVESKKMFKKSQTHRNRKVEKWLAEAGLGVGAGIVRC